jgi:hypothetical protein
MKNVKRLTSHPFFRVPLAGAPPLRGWALRYVSGIEDHLIKPGFWLTQWNPTADGTSVNFNFESELVMCFNDESVAVAVSKTLLDNTEIETSVVKI